jgi:hypothetical protein
MRRILLVLLILGCWLWLQRPADLDRRQSAVWMAHRWFATAPPVAVEAERLQRLGFHDLYFHVGPLDAQGRIPIWDRATCKRNLAAFRAAMPGVRCWAWVGGVTVLQFGKAPDSVDCALPAVRAGIVATDQALLREGGFDGIHYDLEPIASGDPDFLKLLDESPHPLSIAIGCGYAPAYFRQMGQRCDQIAMMTYELGRKDYQEYLTRLVPVVCGLLNGTRCCVLFGVPCYAEVSRLHDPSVETVRAALLGIRDGLRRTLHPCVQGVALYADWTTDDAGWRTFARIWRP